jgi:hypothetical protein
MSFEMIESEADGAVIKVVGVGGAGGNAVNHMINRGVQGVEFITVNTDRQALSSARSGRTASSSSAIAGLGAGANPGPAVPRARRARAASFANRLPARTWSSSPLAWARAPAPAPRRWSRRIAKEMGILTVGVVTKPFDFEGNRKMRIADEGIDQLVEHVDSLIVVLNQKLFDVMDEDASLEDAFKPRRRRAAQRGRRHRRDHQRARPGQRRLRRRADGHGRTGQGDDGHRRGLGPRSRATGRRAGRGLAAARRRRPAGRPRRDRQHHREPLAQAARDERGDQHDQAVLRRRRDDHPRHRVRRGRWRTRCA